MPAKDPTERGRERLTDDRLIEVSNLNINLAICVCHWPQVSEMAVTTNPHCGAFGQRATLQALKPLIEFAGVSANVGVSRARHLCVSRGDER